jgi:hypothetical protein
LRRVALSFGEYDSNVSWFSSSATAEGVDNSFTDANLSGFIYNNILMGIDLLYQVYLKVIRVKRGDSAACGDPGESSEFRPPVDGGQGADSGLGGGGGLGLAAFDCGLQLVSAAGELSQR